MKIRMFDNNDREQVVALWHACGLVVPQNDPIKDIDRKLNVDPDLFLVGHVGDEIIATVMGGYEGHRGWINYLAVKPSHQRKDFGQAIMQAVEALIKAKGCPKINLQVRSSNEAVIRFYQSLGYGVEPVIGMGKRLEIDLDR
ncbi:MULTISPECIES: GNAT family acetyltransferase [Marinomonas]|uniref:GNAT family acetyltransferase n=1 Tax=Marinomonas rhodophyticola TaxID=2992803 RepID=A0ABT3KKP9_9GAMM|nr:GNAT family acetyltransferase [Marinomonas sp. KJ51-3]MCW4631150.1 GNAT family acetyltransferase [Marinomonas sp. KJ51-3]